MVWKGWFQLMQILGLLGMSFDAVVVEFQTFYFYSDWLWPYYDIEGVFVSTVPQLSFHNSVTSFASDFHGDESLKLCDLWFGDLMNFRFLYQISANIFMKIGLIDVAGMDNSQPYSCHGHFRAKNNLFAYKYICNRYHLRIF